MVSPGVSKYPKQALQARVIKNASEVIAGDLAVDQLGVRALDDRAVVFTFINPFRYL